MRAAALTLLLAALLGCASPASCSTPATDSAAARFGPVPTGLDTSLFPRDHQPPAGSLFVPGTTSEDSAEALRRKSRDLVGQGRGYEAVLVAEQACRISDHPKNLAALLDAQLQVQEGRWVIPQDSASIASTAEKLLARPDAEPQYLALVCSAALAVRSDDLLARTVDRLKREIPDTPFTCYYEFVLAAREGRADEAHASLERARALGLPEEVYRKAGEAYLGLRSTRGRLASVAGRVGLAWLGSMLVLFALGIILSRVTLRAARRLPSRPSGEPTGLAGILRLGYRAVLWLSCLIYYVSVPLVLILVLVIGCAVLYLFFKMRRVPIQLVVVVVGTMLVTIWAAFRSLLVRGRGGDPGVRVALASEPGLRGLLEEVASRVGTRPVDGVYLTPGTELAVMERGGLFKQLRGRSERCLILGVGVLEGMKLGPFRAVLAHEYGHFSNRDTAGGGFALAVRRSLFTMAILLAEGGAAAWYNPAWCFLRGFERIFHRISQGASRLQEVLADRWAALLYGAESFERGLRHVIERSIRFEAQAQAAIGEIIDRGKPLSNLYGELSAQVVNEGAISRKVETVIQAAPSPYDSHPSPVDRFAWVRAIGAPAETASADAEQEVWSLFSDRRAVECAMTDLIRANVERANGIRIPATAA